MVFQEITTDHGCAMRYTASDNNAEYVITSARGHDMVADYHGKYCRQPSAKWFNRHFRFEHIR